MEFTTAEITAWVGQFFWPFMRIGGLMVSAPIFSHNSMPLRIRIVLSLALAVMIFPTIEFVPQVEPLSVAGIVISINQVLIGIAMGFLMTMGFSVIIMAGENVAFKMGLGFATMANPQSGVSVPIVSQFLLIIATLLFLSLGGHLILLEILAQSFKTLPIGAIGLTREHFWLILEWGTEMFAGAVILSIPAIMILTMINLALGIMTRAAPTLNIFSVGFPLTLLSGLVIILVIFIPAIPVHMSAIWRSLFLLIRQMLGLA